MQQNIAREVNPSFVQAGDWLQTTDGYRFVKYIQQEGNTYTFHVLDYKAQPSIITTSDKVLLIMMEVK